MDILFERIKSMRLALGMTQEELANKTGYKNKSAIAHIEKGEIDLTTSKIEAFAEALGTTSAWLMGIDAIDEKEQTLQKAFERPEMRTLFSVASTATKEDIENAIKIIEALKGR